jgi:serine/threonine-protein kinase HipA
VTEPSNRRALEDLKTVTRADVYKAGALAGHLTRNAHGGVDFAYTRQWRDSGAHAIATTLPVTPEPVVTAAGALPSFFAGLLPEGRRLGALVREVKTSADDELSLLLAVGGNTVGDVQVVADGDAPERTPARLQIPSFDLVRFAEVLADMDVRSDRAALPGVQDKVSARMISLPASAAGAQVILKLNPREFKHLVENEHFFLGAAREAGIVPAEADLVHDAVGVPGLAVTRFDRASVAGESVSLAVEDGCQVLGRYPSAKYAVTTETVLARLASVCEAPVPAAAEFLAQASFAYLTGNGDAHAKNFSVVQDMSGRWQPAPAYDLPSSQPYGDTTMALSVGGSRDGNITRSRYLALAEHLGVRARAASVILDRVAASADVWLDGLDALPFDQGSIRKLKRVIGHRQQLLRQG